MVTSAPLPPREGMGFYIWNLSRYLARMGHEVRIITRGGLESLSRQTEAGITIWRPRFLPLYPFHVHLHSLFVDRLLKAIESEIDLFHLHSPLVFQPKTSRPVIVTVHTPMKADIRSIKANSLVGFLAKMQAPVSYRVEEGLFKGADSITAVATSVAEELQEYGIDSKKVAVLGNGVDARFFSPDGCRAKPGQPYFLTAGRLGPRKGLEDLLRCARLTRHELPEMRFAIAGRGPLEGKLRHMIEREDLQDRVQLLGHISKREELAALYRETAAYIHPAHYEGLPTTLLEAMACGRPVIATATSGALDVIEDGSNGLLVPPKAPWAMAEAAAQIMGDPDLAGRLGNAARQTIERRYSWEVVGRDYLEEYQKLLAGFR